MMDTTQDSKLVRIVMHTLSDHELTALSILPCKLDPEPK